MFVAGRNRIIFLKYFEFFTGHSMVSFDLREADTPEVGEFAAAPKRRRPFQTTADWLKPSHVLGVGGDPEFAGGGARTGRHL